MTGFSFDSLRKIVGIIPRAFKALNLSLFPLGPVLRNYKKTDASADLRAGINVALVAFPQGIAYAIVAGLPPEMGLISAGLGAMVAGAFSGTRLVVIGPGNSTAILLFSGLVAAGLSEEQRILALPMFIFMVGSFQLIGALANMSIVVNYVSRAVLTAYISAAAALIVVNQIQHLGGFRLEEGSTLITILVGTISQLHETRPVELLVGVSSIILLFCIQKFFPKLPYAAIVLILMSFVGILLHNFNWEVQRLDSFSLQQWSAFNLSIDLEMIGRLAGPAFAVAFVGVLEGASVGRSLASKSGDRINPNQVMLAMGMGNLTNSFLGGMDAAGSITRSALNYASGARTVVSVIIAGAITTILLISVGFLIGYIPKAALAAVILLVAFSLFNRKNILMSLRATHSDALVFILTILAATFFALDTAIYIGVFTSILLFLRKAGIPELMEYQFNEEGQLAIVEDVESLPKNGISILHAEGDLFFGSTELFVEQARQASNDPSLKVVVLRLRNARNIDASSAMAISELHQTLRARDKFLVISGATKEIFRVFKQSRLLEQIGRENFFMNQPSNPTLSTRNALRRAQEIIGAKDGDIRIFVDKRKQNSDREKH